IVIFLLFLVNHVYLTALWHLAHVGFATTKNNYVLLKGRVEIAFVLFFGYLIICGVISATFKLVVMHREEDYGVFLRIMDGGCFGDCEFGWIAIAKGSLRLILNQNFGKKKEIMTRQQLFTSKYTPTMADDEDDGKANNDYAAQHEVAASLQLMAKQNALEAEERKCRHEEWAKQIQEEMDDKNMKGTLRITLQ
ncbi:hypothetical protein DVH24_003337, partial [Malus domestica]